MDETDLNLMADVLNQAPLTPEQHQIWQDARAELIAARLRIQTLEKRIQSLNTNPGTENIGSMVLNKPDFNREAARILAFDERYKTISSIVYFTFENLAFMRERHGNALAEEAIRCICDTFLSNIRRSDIVGRLAPDEFGILFPRCDNVSAWIKGEGLASLVYDALSTSWGPTLKPVISYGAYTFQNEKEASGGLKKAAESLTKLVRQ